MPARALRLAAAVAALLAMSGARSPAVAPPVEHTMTGFTVEQQATVEWAIGLFEDAGLALPAIDFVRSSTVEPCHGRRGWYELEHDRPVVHICIHDGGTIGDRLIVHEIAHAWDSHDLSADRRARFTEWRSLTQWWGQERDRWADYGAEQAAEVISWGVFDRPIRANQVTPPYDGCDHLQMGYVLLTGAPPPRGYCAT